jgi:outer membrane protein OmpA-like peptidoglycan-associated protein
MSPVVRGLFSFLLISAVAMGQQRSFIACPIVRDTKTVPCFLAEYEGETYYLGIQQDITADFHPPQLKHEVLVEGRVKPGPRVCGGVPLEALSISVIKELNLACNTILPPEPGMEAPPAPRGAGPSSKRPEPRAAQPNRTGPQQFTIHYSFNDDYLEYAGNMTVNEAAAYAKRIGGATAKVFGYRATTVLSNGTRLVEKAGLAEKRAKNIETLLRGLGLSVVSSEWKDDPEPGDGQTDASSRRVTISVNPAIQ